MSIDLVVKDAVREVVRQEIRAAFRELAGPGLGEDAPLTFKAAALLISCSPNTIANWVKRGLLAAIGKGRMRRVRRADVFMVLEKLAAPVVVETPTAFAKRLLEANRG